MYADVVLLNNRLGDLVTIIEKAGETRRVIRQNLVWALAYNLLALPAALIGLVPPWAAAIGMSLSSLIVSGNSLRLIKTESTDTESQRTAISA
jgi:Cu2+-exporting ATPase